MKTAAELEAELTESAKNLVKVIEANKLESDRAAGEPNVPVSSPASLSQSPPPLIGK